MVPVAFRLKVSPVTFKISLQCWPVVGIVRYVTWRTWSFAQSIPAYHIRNAPLCNNGCLRMRALLLWRQTARLSHDRLRSGMVPGKCELSQSVEPGGRVRLSLARSTVVENKCTLVPALCREGLFLVYCIKEDFP